MGFFDLFRHPDQDDMTEVERAIAHNEARGDPVPEEWYEKADQGVRFFGMSCPLCGQEHYPQCEDVPPESTQDTSGDEPWWA